MKENVELLDMCMCIVFAFQLIRAKKVRIDIEVKRSEEKCREVMTCDVSPVVMFFQNLSCCRSAGQNENHHKCFGARQTAILGRACGSTTSRCSWINKRERRFERRAGVKYRPIQLIIVEDFAKLTQAAEGLRVGRDKDEI